MPEGNGKLAKPRGPPEPWPDTVKLLKGDPMTSESDYSFPDGHPLGSLDTSRTAEQSWTFHDIT